MNKIVLLLLLSFIFFSCSKTDNTDLPDDNEPDKVLSTEKIIISFKFNLDNSNHLCEIRNDSIFAILPYSTDLTNLKPEIVISKKASINPGSGVIQDFADVVNYKITAEDNSSKNYKAIITKQNSEKSINSFYFTNLAEGQSTYSLTNENPIDIDTITYIVPYLSPVKALISKIDISRNATINPKSEETLNYSQPVKYTVTAEDGSEKEYLIIVDNSLEKVKVDGILGNDYRDKKPSEIISFFTNILNPIKDSIQVKLSSVDEITELDLEIQNINLETNQVSVILPSSYKNDNYRFKVFIEHDNYDYSDGFFLDSGNPNFKYVKDNYNSGNYLTYNSLLFPGENFNTVTYLNRKNIEKHNFYLRKNGQDYPIIFKGISESLEEVRLIMPNLPTTAPASGSDFQFIIKYEEQEFSFPFLNSKSNLIEVIVAEPPIFKSVSNNKIINGDELTVFGENLYYSFINGGTNINSTASIQLKNGGSTYFYHQKEVNYDGSITFNINNIPSGDYELYFNSNIKIFDNVDTGIKITINLTPSNHPTLKVNEATIINKTNPTFAKQILIKFNGTIEHVNIKKIVIEHTQPSVEIENYFLYPTSVLTRALSDEEFSDIYYGNLPDGYVVLEDQGIEYKLPFKLIRN